LPRFSRSGHVHRVGSLRRVRAEQRRNERGVVAVDPSLEALDRIGEPLFELVCLLRDGWCDEGAERVDDHQEADDDERGAESARDAESLEPVDARSHGDAEERTEEHDDHDLVREPEQLEDHVESGDDRGGAQDVRASPARAAGTAPRGRRLVCGWFGQLNPLAFGVPR
jgi:hypothetical protein